MKPADILLSVLGDLQTLSPAGEVTERPVQTVAASTAAGGYEEHRVVNSQSPDAVPSRILLSDLERRQRVHAQWRCVLAESRCPLTKL
jgi:hypothetical protein